ncbi:MAG: DNA-binding MarR family transcriptional regulator [Oceanicoccus sp.]|jgi:DNA-binding MarR family transcriptional regulator
MEQCFNFSLRRANRVLNRIYDRHMKECGLTGGQYTLLRVINLCKTTTNRQLQNILLTDQTTLTRGLKPLIRDGYITVSKGEDMRINFLSLSTSGLSLFEAASRCWAESQKELRDRLGDDSANKFFAITDIVSDLKR